jgi:hypothetical protein
VDNKLIELIARLAKDNPSMIEGLEKGAAGGLQADKMALYELFVTKNEQFTYEAVSKILIRHENNRLDINWNKGDDIYRIVISKRKRLPEKEKKIRTKKGGDNNGNNQQHTEAESTSS